MRRYYIGLMSGTSMDAADAVLVDIPPNSTPVVLAACALPLPADLRDELVRLASPSAGCSLRRLGALDQRIGDWFADAALAVMADAGVTARAVAAIGSHGQTVWHEPGSPMPFSLQLGSASRIAARTGCIVVADFRNSDMAVGGQGAPLVPAFHRHLFALPDIARIVVNIGGMANLTVLPAGANRDDAGIIGLDTGPGNALMDYWSRAHLDAPMDANGRWAAAGTVHTALLERMLQDPYLARAAPKSTGREYFNDEWLSRHLDRLAVPPAPVDVQATLCEYTAVTIAMAVDRYGPGREQILICGGGAHNTHLLARVSALLSPRRVATATAHAFEPDWVEAAALAWLAMQRLEGQPGNLPAVTGARDAAVLGAIYAPPSDRK